MKKKYANMTEFAAALGLARSTVSYILNNKWKERNISPETVERVHRLARESGFSPNTLARMINGKSYTDVAILLHKSLFGHHKEAFFQIINQLTSLQMRYMVFPIGSEEVNRETLDRMRDFRVRSAILFAPPIFAAPSLGEYWINAIRNMPDIPFLLYDCRFGEENFPEEWPEHVTLAGFDMSFAIRKILAHVRSYGFRKAHSFFMRPLDQYGEEFGLTFQRVKDEKALFRLLSKKPVTPEAVIMPDDLLTAAAIEHVLQAGMRVPEDYAFISWDGLPESGLFLRSLTTLQIPHASMLDFTCRYLRGETVEKVFLSEAQLRIGNSMPLKP
ncbi:MAG: LacI family DNA-binding transcriptional regulator [Lentisphaeria bacterium]|nr:LacI family DNA-binding transcriptional regulator [Lentisphaeria bacterium]